MPTSALHANLGQHQALSPRLQQAVRLLQMSSADFVQALSETLQRNPFLEADSADETLVDLSDGASGEPAASAAAEASPAPSNGPDWGDGLPGSSRSGGRAGDDDDGSWMDTMAVETSLAAHLHAQIDLLNIPARDRALAKVVVESLDDDGYLREPLDALIDEGAIEPSPLPEEMRIALCRVQSLEPAGVGARSVQEALLLQLPGIVLPDQRELARRIVSDHLDRLAARDTPGLARSLQRPAQEIEQACARIRQFDPRPGWRFSATRVQYVTPDVIVRKQRGAWTASLNMAIVPKLRMNRVIEELYRTRCRRGNNGELATHLLEARWTLRNVEQRFATIMDVAEAIIERQHAFLDYGPMAMKPLCLREIAEKIGVHESTVSRVTNNKYMATPSGTFELKYFFSRPMATASGGSCSPTALRGLVKTMIEAEQPEAPLSDADITRMLARQGLMVARRTITKYRQGMRFEAAERRYRAG